MTAARTTPDPAAGSDWGLISRLYSLTEEGTVERIAGELLVGVVHAFQSAAENLYRATFDIEDKVQQVRDHVEHGYQVNSLGELQSRGPEFDRLCTRYQETAGAIKSCRYYAEELTSRTLVASLLAGTGFERKEDE